MKKTDLERLTELAQACVARTPVIVLGSGASLAHGIPGMGALAKHLRASPPPTMTSAESIEWARFDALLDSDGHRDAPVGHGSTRVLLAAQCVARLATAWHRSEFDTDPQRRQGERRSPAGCRAAGCSRRARRVRPRESRYAGCWRPRRGVANASIKGCPAIVLVVNDGVETASGAAAASSRSSCRSFDLLHGILINASCRLHAKNDRPRSGRGSSSREVP